MVGVRWLKKVDDQVKISKEQQEKIIENLKNNKRRKLTNIEVGINIAFIIFVIISFPLSTIAVIDMVHSRFQSIDAQEVTELAQEMDFGQAREAAFTRDYTAEEKERLAEITKKYIHGTYPQEKILLNEDSNVRIEEDRLFFAEERNQYQLPERVLTDEELLQIIDHQYRNNYILATRYKDIFWESKDSKKILSKENNEISQSESIKIANSWLTDRLGLEMDGMEISSEYISSEEKVPGLIGLEFPVYIVKYSILSGTDYNFYINAKNGSVEKFNLNNDEIRGKISNSFLATDIEKNINLLYEQSQSFLKEKLKLTKQYSKILCEYNEKDAQLHGFSINFYFIKADGSFDEIGIIYNSKKVFSFASLKNYKAYYKQKQDDLEFNVKIRQNVLYSQ